MLLIANAFMLLNKYLLRVFFISYLVVIDCSTTPNAPEGCSTFRVGLLRVRVSDTLCWTPITLIM